MQVGVFSRGTAIEIVCAASFSMSRSVLIALKTPTRDVK